MKKKSERKEQKKSYKIIKGILIVPGSIIGIILLLLLLNGVRLNVSYIFQRIELKGTFKIPGYKKSYVPQGMAYDKIHNVVLQTSYNGKGKVSKLYVVDFKTKKLLKELAIRTIDGKDNKLHVGGIATNGYNVWITSDYKVSEFSLDEILTTSQNYIESYNDSKLPIRGDFCYCDEEANLWIGDFFLKPFYEVPNDTPLLFKYSAYDELKYDNPELVVSLPKMVQGMTITKDNKFVFTKSFTYLIKSELTTYKNIFKEKTTDTYKFKNKEIPYYHFTKKNLIKNEKLPPMAEGLFYKDNSLYILFESNSSHYPLALPKVTKVLKKSTK